MFRRLENYWTFYVSSLPFSLGMGLLGLLFAGISAFQIFFLLLGPIFCYAMKEVKYSDYYLFYFNNGLTKKQLWLFVFGLNFFWLIVLQVIQIVMYAK
ncbi:hypothetical protein [Flavobacterium sp.]|uniref:hypothetical protein n=1 Tax=Flavobacterium sp. TaxID=239 RepID=UPI003D1092BE